MDADDGAWPTEAGGERTELMKYAVDRCCDPLWKDFMERARGCPGWSQCRENEESARKLTEKIIENIVDHYQSFVAIQQSVPSFSEFRDELKTLRKALTQASLSLKRIASPIVQIEYNIRLIKNMHKDHFALSKKIKYYNILSKTMHDVSRQMEHVEGYVENIDVKGGRGSVYDRIGPNSTPALCLVDQCWDLFCNEGLQYPTTTEGGPFEALCCAVYDLAEGRANASENAGLLRDIKRIRRRRYLEHPNAEKNKTAEHNRKEHIEKQRDRWQQDMELVRTGETERHNEQLREKYAGQGTEPAKKS